MQKERKVNIIRALKADIRDLKKQLEFFMPYYQGEIKRKQLKHYKITSVIPFHEVMHLSQVEASKMLIYKMIEQLEKDFLNFPIKTEFDERTYIYKASIDFWV